MSFRSWCLWGMLGLACWGLAGCGGGRTAETVDEEGEPSEEVAEGEETAGAESPSRPARRPAKKPKAVPNLAGIPLNAFGELPAGKPGAATVAAATPAAKPAAMSAETPMEKPAETEKPAAAAPAGTSDWAALMSGDEVNEEVKQIKLRLTGSLKNVGQYNTTFKDVIQPDGAVLVALAWAMTDGHPDNVTWKPKAKFVRDVAGEMVKAAKAPAQANYTPTNEAWEKLQALLSGNDPAGLPDSADKVPLSEAVNRGPLMRRMEKSFEYMSKNIKTADGLKKEKEQVIHEASLLGALTKAVAADGYTSTDEDEYKGFVKELIDASMAVVGAAKQDDFSAFSEAINKAKNSCDKCHVDYRTGG